MSAPCADSHYVTCCSCGVCWYLPLELPRVVPWLCPDCRPPEPHCETCTCYEATP